jgi:hypothetical protein
VPVIFKQPFHNLRVARDTTGTLFGKSNSSLVSLDSTRCCSGSTLLVNKLEERRFIGIALDPTLPQRAETAGFQCRANGEKD